MKKYEKVTRVEVIDDNGRVYVNTNPYNKVSTDLQDNERTLKIFISRQDNPQKTFLERLSELQEEYNQYFRTLQEIINAQKDVNNI